MAQTTPDTSFGPAFVVLPSISLRVSPYRVFRSLQPIYIIKHQLVLINMKKMKNKNKKETYIWPKQHVCHRLGPFSSSSPSFFPPVAYFVVYDLYIKLNIIQYIKNERIHVSMAQTTPDASFGPVFVVTAFHHSCRVFCRVQPICMLVSTEKNNRFKKNIPRA